MKQSISSYKALTRWFSSALGLRVLEELGQQLTQNKEFLKGDVLLILGHIKENPCFASMAYQKKYSAAPFLKHGKIDIQCTFSQIPLNRNSVDCVFAPFILEPFSNPLSLIDEMDRILKPMGHLMFLGFNPWGLWNGAHHLGLLDCFGHQKIKTRSAFYLNKILRSRGYVQCSLDDFCYFPPLSNPKILKKFKIFDEIGKMLWPVPSGLYLYIAQKHEPIPPSFAIPINNTLRPLFS